MSYDPKLVEAVARAMCVAEFTEPTTTVKGGACLNCRRRAAAALTAIDASGTHWVAPVEATGIMVSGVVHYASEAGKREVARRYAAMRTAYLAKPEDTK